MGILHYPGEDVITLEYTLALNMNCSCKFLFLRGRAREPMAAMSSVTRGRVWSSLDTTAVAASFFVFTTTMGRASGDLSGPDGGGSCGGTYGTDGGGSVRGTYGASDGNEAAWKISVETTRL
jgi:hypothetical protein